MEVPEWTAYGGSWTWNYFHSYSARNLNSVVKTLAASYLKKLLAVSKITMFFISDLILFINFSFDLIFFFHIINLKIKLRRADFLKNLHSGQKPSLISEWEYKYIFHYRKISIDFLNFSHLTLDCSNKKGETRN